LQIGSGRRMARSPPSALRRVPCRNGCIAAAPRLDLGPCSWKTRQVKGGIVGNADQDRSPGRGGHCAPAAHGSVPAVALQIRFGTRGPCRARRPQGHPAGHDRPGNVPFAGCCAPSGSGSAASLGAGTNIAAANRRAAIRCRRPRQGRCFGRGQPCARTWRGWSDAQDNRLRMTPSAAG